MLQENAMLSESISRPSIPLIEELRASEPFARASLSLRSAKGILARFDRALALAVVLAASSAVYYFGVLLIERWQLR
jgi:hypothetical protein